MILKRVWDKSPKYQKNEMTNSSNWSYHLVFIFEILNLDSNHPHVYGEHELDFMTS